MSCSSCVPRIAADGSRHHSALRHLRAWCFEVFEMLAQGLWPYVFVILLVTLVIVVPTAVDRELHPHDAITIGLAVVGLLVSCTVQAFVYPRLYAGMTPEMWHMASHARRH